MLNSYTIEFKTKSGDNAFTCACKRGKVDIVKLFLDYSEKIKPINLNTKCYGKTALMVACEHKNYHIVKLLLESPGSENINVNARTMIETLHLRWLANTGPQL